MNSILNQIAPDASIVVLTGAGISAESGLATFRGEDGLWEGHRVEDVATPEAFACDPDLVHQFYNQRRKGVKDVHPNEAHKALAKLEKQWLGDVLVVTQNIDDLHERGGSENLIHMHGEVLKAFCANCSDGTGKKLDCQGDLSTADPCPDCGYAGGVRPDIVWFGEMPYHMERIFDALQNCDVFISIGTSGNVYPAAGFVREALLAGAFTIECNLEPSNVASAFHEHLTGPAGQTIPDLVEKLIEGLD